MEGILQQKFGVTKSSLDFIQIAISSVAYRKADEEQLEAPKSQDIVSPGLQHYIEKLAKKDNADIIALFNGLFNLNQSKFFLLTFLIP